MSDNNFLEYTINKLLYYIRNNNLENSQELKKYIYTHNLPEDKFVNFKKTFNVYGEMNVYNLLFLYLSKTIKSKNELIKKIKGF